MVKKDRILWKWKPVGKGRPPGAKPVGKQLRLLPSAASAADYSALLYNSNSSCWLLTADYSADCWLLFTFMQQWPVVTALYNWQVQQMGFRWFLVQHVCKACNSMRVKHAITCMLSMLHTIAGNVELDCSDVDEDFTGDGNDWGFLRMKMMIFQRCVEIWLILGPFCLW